MQRRIEPRSADDSLSGVVRCLYFADTFLRDGEARAGRAGERSGPQLAIQETGGGAGGWKALLCLQAAPAARCGPATQSPQDSCWKGSEGSHRTSD